jgi:hypothetical protein
MGRWLRTLGSALGTVSVGIGIVNASPGSALQSLGEGLSSVDIIEKRKQLERLLAESGKRILIMIEANRGADWVLDADVSDCFGSIDHDTLMAQLSKRVSDREMNRTGFGRASAKVLVESLDGVLGTRR